MEKGSFAIKAAVLTAILALLGTTGSQLPGAAQMAIAIGAPLLVYRAIRWADEG